MSPPTTTSPGALKPTSKRSNRISLCCVVLGAAAMLISSALTSCAHAPSESKASLQIFQPRVLLLKAGQPVQTLQGVYIPQVDETWHSAAAYNLVEAEAMNAVGALAQRSTLGK